MWRERYETLLRQAGVDFIVLPRRNAVLRQPGQARGLLGRLRGAAGQEPGDLCPLQRAQGDHQLPWLLSHPEARLRPRCLPRQPVARARAAAQHVSGRRADLPRPLSSGPLVRLCMMSRAGCWPRPAGNSTELPDNRERACAAAPVGASSPTFRSWQPRWRASDWRRSRTAACAPPVHCVMRICGSTAMASRCWS